MPKVRFYKANTMWCTLAFLCIVVDQLTKAYASTHWAYGVPHAVLPFFNFTLVHNHGAAFSMLSDAGGWQRWLFTGLSSVACLVFLLWLLSLPKGQKVLALGLTLLLAGAAGNLIDRVQLGYVIDFLDFHWQGKHFPIFNIADCCVSLGVFFLIVDTLFLEPKRQRA